MLRRIGLVVAIVCAAAPALAQSKRYPPEPVDKDREAAEKSRLWENATNPRTKPYQDLVAAARRALSDRTDDQTKAAVGKLDEAIALLPGEAVAYVLRGSAYMELKDWGKCAADLQAAAARTSGDVPDRRELVEQRRKLGICLARAGKLADAERVLSEAAASGTGTGEMLMRLGEVRIALGKLDEAIAALTSALDATDLPSQALTRWLLASAYDRARRPAEALTEARRAAGYDRSFSALVNQGVPLIGVGEPEYLLGLAWATNEPPWPEKGLVYFRRFQRIAPDSPWKKRVEDHIKELEATRLPEALDRRGGMAPLDTDAALAAVRKQMPAMRACMAKLPSSVLEVLITKVGPKKKRDPATLRYGARRYGYTLPPPEGVSVALTLNVDSVPRADTDAAARCIEPIASRLVLPAVKEPDGWYKVAFLVVSP